MSKSVSIPQALSDLRRSIRFSSAKSRKKSPFSTTTTRLSGFVILVERDGQHVRLYGTAAERAELSIGDEIVGVNEMSINDKTYEDIISFIKECIRKKVIQLKVHRRAVEITADNATSLFNCAQTNRLITDAFLVSVDKDHINEVTRRLKKEYPNIETYDMEYIASSTTPTHNHALRRPPESFELEEKKRKEAENHFLRNSLRQSKKLKALARNVEPNSKVTSFANPLTTTANDDEEQNENTDKTTRITIDDDNHVAESQNDALDDVIISVERIATKLGTIGGDVAMFREFFAAAPVQAAIEQTVKNGRASSGIGSADSASASGSSCASSPIPRPSTSTSSMARASPNGNDDGTTVRVVSVVKDEDSYLGATVRNEDNRIVVGRIVKGGVVERMNLFREGDELLELNGVSLAGKQVNEICDILRNLSGEVTFVVAVRKSDEDEPVSQTRTQHVQHLRALFDYDPEDDVYVPCKELAMQFQRGDILHVLNTSDENWWQAYREGEETSHSLAGLIPSSSFRQQVVLFADEMNREQDAQRKAGKKRDKCGNKRGLEVKKGADEENLPSISVYADLLTYEEVVLQLPKANHRRPIVLCGAEGVGCLRLRDRLLASDRITLACPVPYTSRPPKEGEFNGVHYHFVTRQIFHEEAKAGKFVEFGEFQKHWYGTAKQDVVKVIERGKTCVITLKPESLGAIRCPEVQPYIVFVAAPSLSVLRKQRELDGNLASKDDELKAILAQSKSIEQKYGHLFDGIIVNVDFEKSLNELKSMLARVNVEPMWVPATWHSS